MTRAEVFKIWPRPWRVADNSAIRDADNIEILLVNGPGISKWKERRALAELIVEWSREADEPQPDTFTGAPR